MAISTKCKYFSDPGFWGGAVGIQSKRICLVPILQGHQRASRVRRRCVRRERPRSSARSNEALRLADGRCDTASSSVPYCIQRFFVFHRSWFSVCTLAEADSYGWLTTSHFFESDMKYVFFLKWIAFWKITPVNKAYSALDAADKISTYSRVDVFH